MPLNSFFANREADPAAGVSVEAIQPLENLENFFMVEGIDPDPIILDRKQAFTIPKLTVDADYWWSRPMIFHRVVNEVLKDLR